jgi:SSS family solute:Na+ symporter
VQLSDLAPSHRQAYREKSNEVRKYDSRTLGVLVSIVDLVALIPYLVLQLTDLGIIVTAAGYGAIPKDAAVWIGAAIVTAYIMTSGIRGSAYTSVVKDILILGVVLFLGIYLPLHLCGGIGAMFEKIASAKPTFLIFPPHGESLAWFVFTVLLTAIGFFMWPHSFAACYSANDARVFRRSFCRSISLSCCSCFSWASLRCCKCGD